MKTHAQVRVTLVIDAPLTATNLVDAAQEAANLKRHDLVKTLPGKSVADCETEVIGVSTNRWL